MTLITPAASFVQPSLFDGSARVNAWPFGGLEPQAYDLIMADPPWRFELRSEKGEGKSPQAHYATMGIEEIAALPVADLARENCLLWLWATAPMLDQQIDILKLWGFAFVTSGAWVKTTVTGKLGFGGGYLLRNTHELFLLGRRGELQQIPDVRSVIMAQRREHSRKPDEAYRAAERLMPLARRRVDLFSRETRPGWEAWGEECGKFDPRERPEDKPKGD